MLKAGKTVQEIQRYSRSTLVHEMTPSATQPGDGVSGGRGVTGGRSLPASVPDPEAIRRAWLQSVRVSQDGEPEAGVDGKVAYELLLSFSFVR